MPNFNFSQDFIFPLRAAANTWPNDCSSPSGYWSSRLLVIPRIPFQIFSMQFQSSIIMNDKFVSLYLQFEASSFDSQRVATPLAVLQDVHLITAWDALRFDTPLKWGVTVRMLSTKASRPLMNISLFKTC